MSNLHIGSVFSYLGKRCRIVSITKRYIHFERLDNGIEGQIEIKAFLRVTS